MPLSFFGSPGVLLLLTALALGACIPYRAAKFGLILLATAIVKFDPGFDATSLAFLLAGSAGVFVQECAPLERWIALVLSAVLALALLALALTVL